MTKQDLQSARNYYIGIDPGKKGYMCLYNVVKALCDKAKKAAKEAVEQEQRYGDKRQSTLLF